jgi:Fe-S-cluster containining protein
MIDRYQCDRCGACCKTLIVEADLVDLQREPRLIESDPSYADRTVDEALAILEESGKGLLIACGASRPCQFLGSDFGCAIYPTRPTDCVAMQAGDEQCQYARGAVGLPSLQPVK